MKKGGGTWSRRPFLAPAHRRARPRHKSATIASRTRRRILLVGRRRRTGVSAQGDLMAMNFKSIALAASAGLRAHRSDHRRRAHDARGRLVDRLSVRQDGGRARRARQSAARLADHRIDRHGRRLQAVLRRRRRALPRHRQCLAPDEGEGSRAVRRQRRQGRHRNPDRPRRRRARHRAPDRAFRASPSATSTWRSPRRRSASPTGPRPGRTSTPSCRRCRSASTARRRPAARATRSANC